LRVNRELEPIEHVDTLARAPRLTGAAPADVAADGTPAAAP
jgi:hypothetical protein